MNIDQIFKDKLSKRNGVWIASDNSTFSDQSQTNDVFTDKWQKYSEDELKNQLKFFEFQKNWYLSLYNFKNENELKEFLISKEIILDAGCGLGYKANWFAELSPNTQVIGMDFSDSVFIARETYKNVSNLEFVKGDIADTKFNDSVLDYVSCDQVIHHTENPQLTMIELSRILKMGGELAVYVYAKKALPRELLDEHFREKTKSLSDKDLWEMSEQLTILGKNLSELNKTVKVPDIPILGIQGGEMDVQRFIYWNLIKCFWNEDLGLETSISTNFDWYAPSNAERYTKDEFLDMVRKSNLSGTSVHSEEACHSGRFTK